MFLRFVMMARPLKPRTELARRLIEAREASGFKNRGDLAEKLGIPADTLGSYERGVAEPGLELFAQYRELLGVDLNWLTTGTGERFADPSKAPAPSEGYDIVLLAKLGDAVQAVFLEAKQSAPPRAITTEAGRLYNELLGMVKDIRDEKVVEAMIPVLRERFRERIQNAEPGSGKRSAS